MVQVNKRLLKFFENYFVEKYKSFAIRNQIAVENATTQRTLQLY